MPSQEGEAVSQPGLGTHQYKTCCRLVVLGALWCFLLVWGVCCLLVVTSLLVFTIGAWYYLLLAAWCWFNDCCYLLFFAVCCLVLLPLLILLVLVADCCLLSLLLDRYCVVIRCCGLMLQMVVHTGAWCTIKLLLVYCCYSNTIYRIIQ